MFCSRVARLPPHTTLSNFGERDSPALVSTGRGKKNRLIDWYFINAGIACLHSCAQTSGKDKWQWGQPRGISGGYHLIWSSCHRLDVTLSGAWYITAQQLGSRNFPSILVFDWSAIQKMRLHKVCRIFSQCCWSGPSQQGGVWTDVTIFGTTSSRLPPI